MGARDIVRRIVGLALALVLSIAVVGANGSVADGSVPREAVAHGSSECAPTEPVPGANTRVGHTWIAETDLSAVARLLSERDGIFRPFPGLAGASQSGRAPADGPIRIVLVRDLACLAALGLSDPGADWVAGLAVLGERTIALRVERSGASIPAVAAVLRHELAHVALHVASAGRAPRWLQEGYAQLESGTWDWSEAWRLRWTFLRGSGERLQEIRLAFPRDPDGARLAYQLSYTAVQTLWELSGERGFSGFVAELAEGATTDQAFRAVFGITEGQFAERWQQSVEGRYGLLYTLSRAGAFSALISIPLLWASLRRRRIRRERMEQLRESDRRDGTAFGYDGFEAPPGMDVDANQRSV